MPAGWEKLDYNCDTHQSIQRMNERLNRRVERLSRNDRFEEEDFNDTISDIREHLEEDNPYMARIKMEDLDRKRSAEMMRKQLKEFRQDLNRFEEEERSSGNLTEIREELSRIEDKIEEFENSEREAEKMEEELDQDIDELRDKLREKRRTQTGKGTRRANPGEGSYRTGEDQQSLPERRLREQLEEVKRRDEDLIRELPPELSWLNDTYEEPENMESRIKEVKQLIEDEHYYEARSKIDSIRQDQMDAGLGKIQTATDTYRKIYNLRDSEQIEKQQIKRLDEAETVLTEDRNVTQAEQMVSDVESEVRADYLRSMAKKFLQDPEIRKAVKDILSGLIPGL